VERQYPGQGVMGHNQEDKAFLLKGVEPGKRVVQCGQ